MLRNPVHFLALGLGSGLSPKAPGTAGSLAALLLFVPIALLPLQWTVLFVVLACVLGAPICDSASKPLGGDHGAIVWDEFAGLWLCLLFALPEPLWWLVAFVLFRLFDVLKPWPIGWLDKRVHGGPGILLDDLVAGLMAAACLILLQYQFA